MNEKLKKSVAGIVLGTFVMGAATPAFAVSDSMPYEDTNNTMSQSMYSQSTTNEHVIIIEDSSGSRGKITITLKALKNVLKANKDTIKDVLVGLNIVQDGAFDKLFNAFMSALDFFFDTNDTIEGVIVDALTSLGVSESLATLAAKAITQILF